ncbi:MAG: O-antigen ligase family protein, partial [Nitrospirota bacterium]
FALLATLSRASFLAAGVVTLLVVLFLNHRRPLLFMLILVGLLGSPWWAPSAVKQRLMHTFTQAPEQGQIRIGSLRVDTSTSDRLRAWRESIDWWKKSPVWGHGVTGGPFMDAMYPRVLTETGLLGLAAFLAVLWMLFRVGLITYQQSQDPFTKGLALGFLFGFVGLLVHAIGANTFIIVRIMEPFWLYVAMVARGFLMLPAYQSSDIEARAMPAIDRGESKRAGSPA